jgi:hypothetical protein
MIYDDDHIEVSDRNLSIPDDIPISMLNLGKQRSITDLDEEDANFMRKTIYLEGGWVGESESDVCFYLPTHILSPSPLKKLTFS